MLYYIKKLLRLIFKFFIVLILVMISGMFIYLSILTVRMETIANSDDSDYTNKIFSEDLQIHMVDVGQGDGFVIIHKDKVIVVDCGTVLHPSAMSDYLQDMGVKRINALILSHPHQDHFGGIDKILCHFKVDKIYTTKISTKTDMSLIERFHMYRCNSTIAIFNRINNYSKVKSFKNRNGTLKSFSVGGMQVDFLGPINDYNDINNNSLVFTVNYKDISILFTGDIEKEAELDLVEKYGDKLKCDILKLPHHASHTSSSEEFLAATQPKIALISCAIDNDFWHPHKQVAKRLEETGIILYRTDEYGDIVLVSDGNCIESDCNEGDYKYGQQLSQP